MAATPTRTATIQKTARDSIDSILNSQPAKLLPPNLTKLLPSWIGPKRPDRPITPGGATMKLPVTVEFESPGLQPPVFVSTDLTEPQWEPTEMEGSKKEDGEYRFKTFFQVEEGEYQYKLRLGSGDWWVCDGSKPTVDDGVGNQNNTVIVKAEVKAPMEAALVLPAALPQTERQPASLPPVAADATPKPAEEKAAAVPVPADPAPKPAEEKAAAALSAATPNPLEKPAPKDEDVFLDSEEAPLLRHESVAPSSIEQTQAPLFRHESMAIDDKKHDDFTGLPSPVSSTSTRSGSTSTIPEEADPNDPSLVRFPSDHAGIMAHLEQARTRLSPDLPVIEVSPPGSASKSDSAPSLPSVQEADEEAETLPAVREQAVPDAPITPPITPKERDLEVREAVVAEELAEVVEETAEAQALLEMEAKKLERLRRQEARQAAVSAVTLALGFVGAVAVMGIAVWLTGSGEGVVE